MDDLDIDDPRNGPRMLAAIRNGDFAAVRSMLDAGESPDTADEDGWSALQVACQREYWDIAWLLLDRGASPKSSLEGATTPAAAAAEGGEFWTLLRLRDAGASVEGTLCEAASAGHTHIARYLLDHGTPVDERDHWGVTPLMAAAANGHLDVITLLLERGADVDATNEDETARDYAEYRNQPDVIAVLDGDEPAPRRWMRWFTPEFNFYDEGQDAETIVTAYRQHVAALRSQLPLAYRVLTEAGGQLSLHDASFVSVERRDNGELVLGIEAFDRPQQQNGRFIERGDRLRLLYRYTDGEVIAGQPLGGDDGYPDDILHGEIDVAADGRWEHRLQMAKGPTVVIRFRDATLAAARIYDEIELVDLNDYLPDPV